MIASTDRFGNLVVAMSNGAVFKLREDEEGDLEIRETTHCYINIKPSARNTVYIQAEDPMKEPKTTPEDYSIGRTSYVANPGYPLQESGWNQPDLSPDSPHPGKPHEDCCK